MAFLLAAEEFGRLKAIFAVAAAANYAAFFWGHWTNGNSPVNVDEINSNGRAVFVEQL